MSIIPSPSSAMLKDGPLGPINLEQADPDGVFLHSPIKAGREFVLWNLRDKQWYPGQSVAFKKYNEEKAVVVKTDGSRMDRVFAETSRRHPHRVLAPD